MRFLISVIDDRSNSGTEAEMKAVNEFNDKLEANGHWVFACGLADPKGATVFDNRADAGIVYEGPLFNVAEQFSGFWVVKADDEATARALAIEGSKACNRKVELRPLL
ncbi:MAG: hypothetical protein RLZZ56_672 [Actinomycetota bacterium]|jgi:hypothetical protein